MVDSQPTTTSFIPKTRLTAITYRAKGFGLGFFISTIILLLALASFAGVYFYKQSLQKQIADEKASLERAKQAFEPGLISELAHLNVTIDAAKILMANHQALSDIFSFLSDLTLSDTSFSNFHYGTIAGKPVVDMAGEASSYTGVALQAKLFRENDLIEQVSFSNLSLKEAGKVSFSIELVFKPAKLIYKSAKQ